jgi:16S rRNA (uracil1498-N3)-methyltransferase
VVQKLTEAGVDCIAVLGSARAVVRWDGDRLAKAMDRLARVAREAAAQSRRAWLPELAAYAGPGALATHVAPARLVLAQPGGPPLGAGTSAVAVGPEGGWDDAEVAGVPCVGLGPTILRAETAALAAGLLMCALRAGVVAPAAGPPPAGAPGAPSSGHSCNHHAE